MLDTVNPDLKYQSAPNRLTSTGVMIQTPESVMSENIVVVSRFAISEGITVYSRTKWSPTCPLSCSSTHGLHWDFRLISPVKPVKAIQKSMCLIDV
jgi:hypothetical protein